MFSKWRWSAVVDNLSTAENGKTSKNSLAIIKKLDKAKYAIIDLMLAKIIILS